MNNFHTGNSDTLCSHETWKQLIEFYHNNDAYINIPTAAHVDRAFELIFSKSSVPSGWRRFENQLKYGSSVDKKTTLQEYPLPDFSKGLQFSQKKISNVLPLVSRVISLESLNHKIPKTVKGKNASKSSTGHTSNKKTHSQYEASLPKNIKGELDMISKTEKKVKKAEKGNKGTPSEEGEAGTSLRSLISKPVKNKKTVEAIISDIFSG